jgi:hypothetical protein
MSPIEARTVPSVSQGPNALAPANIPTSGLPRAPQAILSEFEAAMQKAGRVADLAKGRPSNGIVECVRKLINAERQRAEHILAAASLALSQLPLPR